MSSFVIVMSIDAIAILMFSESHSVIKNTIAARKAGIKLFVNSVFRNAFSTMIKVFKFVNSSIRHYYNERGCMGKDSSFNSSICH